MFQTERKLEQVHRALKRCVTAVRKSLSLVLAFSIIISVSVVSGFSVSADSTIELYYENSSNWSTVKAYAWDSMTGTKYLGDFPGQQMTCVSVNVYKISVSTSADMIIFNGGSDSQKTADLELPSGSGKIFKNGSWSDYSSSPETKSGTYEYDAQTDSSFDDVSFAASCSLYDYLDDQELQSGIWGNVKTAGNSATWYPFSTYNSILSDYYSSNNVKNPLYFGNFNTGSATEISRQDEYNYNKGSLYNYNAAPNNSKAVWYDCETEVDINDTAWLASCADPSSWAYSYQGIVSNQLGADGSLQLVQNNNSGTVAAPFFSDSFLSQQYSGTSTMLGRKVNTVLPFVYDSTSKKYSYQSSVETTHSSPVNGIYLSNSNRGSSNNNLNGVSGDSLTMVYGGSNASTAILDGKQWFNSGSSGYGFFPFNNNTGSHTGGDVRNDLNYGFGMALTVDFTVPTDGCVEGTSDPVEFTFTGDDDIWIFIDDKLVVDLGGDHKDASCTLNFKDNTTTYTTGINTKSVTSASDEYTLAEVMEGSTGNTVHTLKMFYMERGLIESNLRIEFSFSPVDNYLTTTKTVNTANVNDGIKSAVSQTDDFKFTNSSNGKSNNTNIPLSGKEYTHTDKNSTETTKTSDSAGSYNMKDGDTASYTNITESGDYITVSEDTSGNVFKYTSSYTVTDVQNNIVKVNNASGTSANFLFKNEVNENHAANYRVDFVNTPQVNDLSVSKVALDSDGTAINDVDFDFSIALSLDGSDNYVSYPLVYEIGGVQYTASNGSFKLKGGQTAEFKNIPVGAKYRVTEAENSDYTTQPSSRTINGTIGNGPATENITFTNTKIDKSAASVVLNAQKLLDGVTPDVNTFEFTLTNLTLNGNSLYDGDVIQTKTNAGKDIVFDALVYNYIDPSTLQSPVEKFYYKIAETANLSDGTYTYDSSVYYVVVTVDRSTAPITAQAKYYSTEAEAVSEINYIQSDDVVFNNYHKGSLEITKKDGDGQIINDSVQFSLYKTDSNGGEISESNLVETKTVDQNGKATFENLDIFVNQDNNDTSERQWYCFVETTSKDGYNINSEKHYFTIPFAQANEDQNSDVYDFISDGVKYSYVLGKDGKPVYNLKYDVDNFPIVAPKTSGSGMDMFILKGLGIIGLGIVTFSGYMLSERIKSKRRKSKYRYRR